jgi:hypothetical protein
VPRDWDHHVNSADHRECIIAPRPISPDQTRPIEPDALPVVVQPQA